MDFSLSVQQALHAIETPGLEASTSLAAKLGAVQGLVTFPAVGQAALAILADPDFRMNDLATVINRDPAIAAKVMRLANSAYFNRGTPLDSIGKAVVRLGRSNVADAVTAVAAMSLFEKVDRKGVEIRDHLAATAAISREIARYFHLFDSGALFLCGLLHDMGKLLLIMSQEMVYDRLENSGALETPEGTVSEEQRTLGFDHGILAGQLLWHWRLPHPISQIVAWHHQPSLAYSSDDAAVPVAVAVTRLASRIERQLAYNLTGMDDFVAVTCASQDAQRITMTPDYFDSEWENLAISRNDAITFFS